ncbi:VOC family protein [Azospirillum sp.]|uniref:VOC family protein n=1 Tax=Azospirillum sp. TaxID=34012 RepID=UPI0026133025|nr:VOC family protein [Azospirillum sp.]
MIVQPYLFFEGRCEEAITFYQRVLGANVEMLLRFQDSPDPCPEGMIPPGSENKIMHASLRIGDSMVMASDGGCAGGSSFKGFSLSVTVADADEANRVFAALGDGGAVLMPLGKTFFSPCFGMVQDQFGVSWMVIVQE